MKTLNAPTETMKKDNVQCTFMFSFSENYRFHNKPVSGVVLNKLTLP